MADVTQIYQIVNSIAEQSMGMTGLTLTDTSFISVGKTVLSSSENIDAFYKTLVDRIGRTVLAIREYRSDMTELAREPFEYGAILQKISFALPQAQANETWKAVTDAPDNPFAKTAATFKQVFFDKISTWEVAGTIPDVQLETAFTSEQAMMAFIDGIFTSMYNSLEIAYENNGHLARASLIASVVNSAKVTCAINLLTAYNTETNASLTVAAALKDTDFLKYASSRIKLVSDRMTKMSTTFNPESWQRFTPKNLQVFEVLADFANALDTYLQADTYHNELTKLEYYKTIPYWQGSGTEWDFASVSSVNVTIETVGEDGALTPTNVEQSGIIAVIRDIDSAGITIDKRRTKSLYNPHGEYTNYWIKADLGQFRDNSENCVVFYMAET